MKINRTKSAAKNIFFGVLLRIYRIIIPFLMRSVFIYTIGIEFLGLNSLFVSVLQVLNLAELGVGSAMVYSMYKPITEDDEATICALMRLYKIYYRIIGVVILVLGLCVLPVLPYLIKGSIPEGISIYVLYGMHLGCTVLSYWLFAYKNSLLTAYQRSDVTSKVSLGVDTLKYILQLLALVVFGNYYFYVLVMLFTQVVENIVVSICVNKLYPNYHAKGKLEKEHVRQISCRIRDLFTSQVGMMIINAADTIVISAFLGLTVLAVYQNYFYIITSITGLMSTIYVSCRAGIGNSLIVENEEKNYKDLSVFTLIIGWISTVGVTCMLCLMQPFMVMWMGNDKLLDMGCVICFCIYFFVFEINQLLCTYKDAAGIWRKDRFRPLITAFTNLGINLLLVNYMGIYGVLLSTVISTLVVGMPWLLNNLFSELFHCNLKKYVYELLKHMCIAAMSCAISFAICKVIPDDGIITWAIKAMLCIVVSNGILFCAWRKEEAFFRVIDMVKRMLKGKL